MYCVKLYLYSVQCLYVLCLYYCTVHVQYFYNYQNEYEYTWIKDWYSSKRERQILTYRDEWRRCSGRPRPPLQRPRPHHRARQGAASQTSRHRVRRAACRSCTSGGGSRAWRDNACCKPGAIAQLGVCTVLWYNDSYVFKYTVDKHCGVNSDSTHWQIGIRTDKRWKISDAVHKIQSNEILQSGSGWNYGLKCSWMRKSVKVIASLGHDHRYVNYCKFRLMEIITVNLD